MTPDPQAAPSPLDSPYPRPCHQSSLEPLGTSLNGAHLVHAGVFSLRFPAAEITVFTAHPEVIVVLSPPKEEGRWALSLLGLLGSTQPPT